VLVQGPRNHLPDGLVSDPKTPSGRRDPQGDQLDHAVSAGRKSAHHANRTAVEQQHQVQGDVPEPGTPPTLRVRLATPLGERRAERARSFKQSGSPEFAPEPPVLGRDHDDVNHHPVRLPARQGSCRCSCPSSRTSSGTASPTPPHPLPSPTTPTKPPRPRTRRRPHGPPAHRPRQPRPDPTRQPNPTGRPEHLSWVPSAATAAAMRGLAAVHRLGWGRRSLARYMSLSACRTASARQVA